MHFVRWTFQNLEVPMIEIEGVLYTTNKVLSDVLGVTESGLRNVYSRHKDEFDNITVPDRDAKALIQQYKVELGIERVRDNIRLWTEDDMILFAALSRSDVSKQFRKDLVKFIKENAQRGMVTKEAYEQLEARVVLNEHKTACLEQAFQAASISMDKIASQAARNLRMQAETKPFRTLKLIKGQ